MCVRVCVCLSIYLLIHLFKCFFLSLVISTPLKNTSQLG